MRRRRYRKAATRWLWGGWAMARPLRPGQLMRRYGLGYLASERLIRHHTLTHWRRYGWIGAAGLAPLAVRLACAFAGIALPSGLGTVLLAGFALCMGLQSLLAQRAAWPDILREAAVLRANRRTVEPH